MTSVTFPSTNALGDCPAIVTGNPSKMNRGIIVLQEWWGMNEQILQKGKDLANQGNFVTLVPDLYRGKVAKDREEAGHLMSGLDWKGAVQDIEGAVKYLMSIGCAKVGVTGFCMGGALTLAAAALVKEVSAAAPFYGIPKKELCDLATIRIPVQAHFGELDDIKGFSSPEDAKALEETLKGKCDFTLYMYPAQHGFTNNTSPRYSKECSDKAFQRLIDFMTRTLKSSNL